VLQPGVLGGDLVPFALAQAELFQIGNQNHQFVAFRFALREIFLRFIGHCLQPLPVAVGVAGLPRQVLRARMRIEQRALRGRPQQRLVLVLAVDVDQVLAGGFELRERGGMAVDEAARAAAAVDGAPDNQRAGIAGEIRLNQPIGQRRFVFDFKFRRQLRALGALPHQPGVGAAADQQLDRVHQHRLARAGLAGKAGEAFAELERGFLDQDQVADIERAQH
jgi:hypothetical protein